MSNLMKKVKTSHDSWTFTHRHMVVIDLHVYAHTQVQVCADSILLIGNNRPVLQKTIISLHFQKNPKSYEQGQLRVK